MNGILEICVDNFESAKIAQSGGADRIELCSALSEGGLTPSYGFTRTCLNSLKIDIFPMIRPRGGHFVYSKEELQIMLEDIQQFKDLGVHGVVVGILNKQNHIDEIAMRRMINAARPLPVTFHRAFDVIDDPLHAIEKLIQLKVDRLLTSGQQKRAIDGIELIESLQSQFGHKIKIMAGSGVNHQNLQKILTVTGVSEIHGSARIGGEEVAILEEIKTWRRVMDKF